MAQSIKEKAEELTEKRIELSKQESIVYFQGFEVGANYVLDEIENSLQDFSNYEDSLIISRIIEQLKK